MKQILFTIYKNRKLIGVTLDRQLAENYVVSHNKNILPLKFTYSAITIGDELVTDLKTNEELK